MAAFSYNYITSRHVMIDANRYLQILLCQLYNLQQHNSRNKEMTIMVSIKKYKNFFQVGGESLITIFVQ